MDGRQRGGILTRGMRCGTHGTLGTRGGSALLAALIAMVLAPAPAKAQAPAQAPAQTPAQAQAQAPAPSPSPAQSGGSGDGDGGIGPGFFTGRIRATFEEIGSLPPGEFPQRLPGLRARVDRFIDHQKKVCQGEFSTVVLDGFGEGGGPAGESALRKLDGDERKLCFRELQAIQVAFISSVHRARRAYLVHVHERELAGLDALRDEAVKSVQRSFLSL